MIKILHGISGEFHCISPYDFSLLRPKIRFHLGWMAEVKALSISFSLHCSFERTSKVFFVQHSTIQWKDLSLSGCKQLVQNKGGVKRFGGLKLLEKNRWRIGGKSKAFAIEFLKCYSCSRIWSFRCIRSLMNLVDFLKHWRAELLILLATVEAFQDIRSLISQFIQKINAIGFF
jgi:hypothetical protein